MGYGLENIAAGHRLHGRCASRSASARRSRRSTSRRWCRSGSCRSRSSAATRSSLKPSEQVPLSQQRMFELLEQCDLPPGVVNLVNGGREVVEAICDHPGIRAVSFVGSTPVARLVYQRGDARRQARAGARRRQELHRRHARRRSRSQRSRSSPSRSTAARASAASPAACSCRSATRTSEVRDRLVDAARALKVGDGLEPGVDDGPGDQRARTGSACSATSRRASRRARSSSLDGRGVAASPIGRAATSSARRSSTT